MAFSHTTTDNENANTLYVQAIDVCLILNLRAIKNFQSWLQNTDRYMKAGWTYRILWDMQKLASNN